MESSCAESGCADASSDTHHFIWPIAVLYKWIILLSSYSARTFTCRTRDIPSPFFCFITSCVKSANYQGFYMINLNCWLSNRGENIGFTFTAKRESQVFFSVEPWHQQKISFSLYRRSSHVKLTAACKNKRSCYLLFLQGTPIQHLFLEGPDMK